MATEKKTTGKKTTSKAATSTATSAETISRRTVKKAQKRVKKLPAGVKIALVAVLLVAMAAGAGTAYWITRNDRFTLDTNASVLFTEGDTVQESELKCKITAVAFGRDISDTLTLTTTLPDAENGILHLTEGIYYTTYTVKTPLGRTIKRIQTITVMSVSEAGGDSLG